MNTSESLDVSVVIATNYGLDGWGSIPDIGKKFSLLHNVQKGSGVHPVSLS
jgi:hypothetical protein